MWGEGGGVEGMLSACFEEKVITLAVSGGRKQGHKKSFYLEIIPKSLKTFERACA